MTPEWPPEEPEIQLCPFCGAYSTKACELFDETGTCPWEDMKENEEPPFKQEKQS